MRRLFFLILFPTLLAPTGYAAEAAAEKAKDSNDKAVVGEVPDELLMEEVEIRGELERPDVFYIIPRRKATMDLGVLSKDYKEEIMQPLLPQYFEKVHGRADQKPR